MRKSHKIMVGE